MTSVLPARSTTPPPPSTRVQVVAHRGGSAAAPENTLSALRVAMAQGADAVEIDVRRSRDGEFVVIHDPEPTRTTDIRLRKPGRCPQVDELTLAELRTLDAGSWKGPSFVGERIPTLAEVLDLVRLGHLGLLVEVKRPVGRGRHDVRDLARVLGGAGLDHRRLTVQSFDRKVVQDLRSALPTANLAVLTRNLPRDVAQLSTWVDQVSLHHHSADRRAVDAVQGWGMRCVVWTVNRPVAMRRMLGLGVDGVITDHPARLARLRGQTKRPGAWCAGPLLPRGTGSGPEAPLPGSGHRFGATPVATFPLTRSV